MLYRENPSLHEDDLSVTPEGRAALEQWLTLQIEQAFSDRAGLETLWNAMLRSYDAPKSDNLVASPIEGFGGIEIPVGASACDDIYAVFLDTVFATDPIVTARHLPKNPGSDDNPQRDMARALQRFIDWGVRNEWNVRAAADNTLLDDIMLGTGAYYTVWFEEVRKHRVETVTWRGARIFSVAPEDIVLPAGSYDDAELAPWVGVRYNPDTLTVARNVRLDLWTQAPAVAGNVSNTRLVREQLDHMGTGSTRQGCVYEVLDVYCAYDIDGDGIDEELLVTWDRTAKKTLRIRFQPYDHRPLSLTRYQLRAHTPYGKGVMEMLSPFQQEVTDTHNYRRLNAFLANCRIIISPTGTLPETVLLWPGRNLEVTDPQNVQFTQMADIYPSMFQDEAMTMQLAEQRVGKNSMFPPRSSGSGAGMGSRTPVGTMQSIMAQTNKRQTPAFDGFRLATADAVRQCLYRYQEKLLAEYTKDQVENKFKALLGEEDGALVATLLKDKNFHHGVEVDLTALSATTNREVEKQNAVAVMDLMFSRVYTNMLKFMEIASNPTLPVELRETAGLVFKKSQELAESALSKFREIRDPARFLVQLSQIQQVMQEEVSPSLPVEVGAAAAAMNTGQNGVNAGGFQNGGIQ
jgi:hypothetical protein